MKIKILKDLCIGCGSCVSVDDNAFAFDDDGKAKVIGETDKIKDAQAACPVSAIVTD